MRKRTLSIVLAAAMCASLTACGGGGSTAETTAADSSNTETKAADASEKSDKPLRVCVVYTGNLGDKSYNDSCNMGAQKAVEDFGIELKSLEGTTAEEGSFLAGAAAAMFTTKTDIPNVNEDHIIGWVGGMDIPVLHDFYTGYEQGAKYIDPDIKILQAFAGSWTDPLKGKELTLAQYEQGADIVMNVASGTGVGILEGAKEADKYAIGVDLNQDSDQPGHILTSMVKRVDNACYLVIQSAVDGTFEGGTTKYLALKDGGVSLTDFSVIKESLGDKFPQDIVDKCDELAEKIKSGEIVVENYEGFGPEA